MASRSGLVGSNFSLEASRFDLIGFREGGTGQSRNGFWHRDLSRDDLGDSLLRAEMWLSLVAAVTEGGADVIESKVFWNGHELSPGNGFVILQRDSYLAALHSWCSSTPRRGVWSPSASNLRLHSLSRKRSPHKSFLSVTAPIYVLRIMLIELSEQMWSSLVAAAKEEGPDVIES